MIARILQKYILVALFLTTVSSSAIAQKSLKALLDSDSNRLDYVYDTERQSFRILVSDQGEASLIIAKEKSFGDDDPNWKIVYLYCVVIEAPKGFKHPEAMLKRMAELNDNMLVGKVGITEEGNIYYDSSFWLRTADASILRQELAIAHMLRIALKKELLPFMEE